MTKNKLTHLALMSPTLALLSCAAPKAVVVEEAPVSKKKRSQQTAVVAPEPSRSLQDDGIRLPDMLGLPGENEFRSTRPATTSGGSGAVIARPPVEAKSPP